jgi:hypothetical protein
MIISWMMEMHVYSSVVFTLRHVSSKRYTSTHLIHKQIDQGTYLTNFDTYRGCK